jgi:hypothetical protein
MPKLRPSEVAPERTVCLGDLAEVRVEIYVDDTIVEVFAEEYAVLTTRIYPNDGDDCAVDLVAAASNAHFTSVELSEFRALSRLEAP